MTEKTVMDALVQMKRMGNLLNEVEDITQQMAQAIDRNDQVSVQMLLAMREEPLEKLQAADRAVREQLEVLPEEAPELAALLNGAPPAQPGERTQQMLCDQVASNRRRLKQIMELDAVLGQRLGRGDPADRQGGVQA